MNLNHPAPWVALPADGADLVDGVGMWFFNDANGEEVFYGHAMSIEVRNLVLAAVNGVPDPADAQTVRDAARYRLLRRKVYIVGDEFRVLDLNARHYALLAEVELDAVIDASMQSNQGGKQS